MKELTDEQIKRQDFVDNTIYQLIQEINPADKMIAWDIEMIGDVRDVINKGSLKEKILQPNKHSIRTRRSKSVNTFLQST